MGGGGGLEPEPPPILDALLVSGFNRSPVAFFPRVLQIQPEGRSGGRIGKEGGERLQPQPERGPTKLAFPIAKRRPLGRSGKTVSRGEGWGGCWLFPSKAYKQEKRGANSGGQGPLIQ